jgi:DnaJ homolog subfamily A member 2
VIYLLFLLTRLRSLLLDEVKVIKGQGMPSQRHHEPGDLYVKLTVKFPDHMDPNVIPLLEKALPPRKPLEKFTKNVEKEEVDLVDVDSRKQEHANRMGSGDDMDTEEDGGHPGVQCANQ